VISKGVEMNFTKNPISLNFEIYEKSSFWLYQTTSRWDFLIRNNPKFRFS